MESPPSDHADDDPAPELTPDPIDDLVDTETTDTETTDTGAPDPVVGAGVPAVVAVLVTRDPGSWFVAALEGLAAQEYPNLSVLVIDAGSSEDPTPIVAAALPSAFVKRVLRHASFAEAANEALGAVEGATFLLFCHDDSQLAPGAVQGLVSTAFRENAGIVGAKLVDWDRPDRLRSMGAKVDRFGATAPMVEPGELDQSQHDATTEVAVVSTAAMLVRADLFEDLGGFSTDIDGICEDLDLCWRARVAGARTVVTPAGVARHRELARLGDPDVVERRRAVRHQARIVLAVYSPVHLLWVLPLAALGSALDLLLNVVTGRFRQAGDIVSAWTWNIGHLPRTLRIRRRVAASRRSADTEVRSTQIGGSVRLRSYLGSARSMGERRLPAALAAARDLPGHWQEGSGPAAALAVVGLVVFTLIAGRNLFGDGLSVVREFAPLSGVSALLRGWWNGWSSVGLGHNGPVPPNDPMTWLATIVTFGSTALARTLAVLAAFVIAPIGSWRVFRGVASVRVRLVAALATLVVAVPFDAAGEGRLQALAVYAAMPWLLGRIFRMTGLAPFDHGVHRSPARQGRGLGLTAAAAFVVAPIVVVVLVGLGLAVMVGSVLGGRARAAGAVGVGTLSAVATLAVVQLPTTIALLGRPDRWWLLVGSSSPLPKVDATMLLRLSSGTTSGGWLLMAVPLAALVPLLVAGRWRLWWAAQCWIVALGALSVVVVVARWAPDAAAPALPLLFAPAAVALALAAALGVAAFESEVVGGTFGWRQLVALFGLAAVALSVIPALASAGSGRFDLPDGDVVAAVSSVGGRDASSYRTIWLGAPDDLPLRGRVILPGLAMGITTGMEPSVENLQPPAPGDGELALASVVRATLNGESARLGRQLSAFAVSHVVVVTDPTAAGAEPTPEVANALATLGAQLDLREVSVAPGLGVYESAIAGAIRRRVPTPAAVKDGAQSPTGTAATDPEIGRPGFRQGDAPTWWRGPVSAGESVVLSMQGRDWRLGTHEGEVSPKPFQRWAQRFAVTRGSTATLSVEGSTGHRILLIVQGLLILVTLAAARGRTPVRPGRRREPASVPAAGDPPPTTGDDT